MSKNTNNSYTEEMEPGTLVTLYNCYFTGLDNLTRVAPRVTGMYIKTGRSGQFEYYEIAVIKDETGRGGFVQRYLTSDFLLTKMSSKGE